MTLSRSPDPEQTRQDLDNEIDLGTLWQGVRRQLPVILLVALLVALAVYLWSRTRPPVYEASASIIASSSQSQIGVVGGSVVSPLPEGTVAQVVQSPLILQPLIQAVQKNEGIAPAERQRLVRKLTRDLLNQSDDSEKPAQNTTLTVRAEQGSGENSVYTLRARAQSAGAAQILANLASAQLLAWDAARTLRDVRLARQNFELQLEQINRRLSLPGLTPQERLTLIYRRATMQDNLAQIGFLESVRTGVLKPLASAVRPLRPVTPSPLRNALLAGLLTLFLGVGVAALRAALDPMVRSEGDLLTLNLPTLAVLPRLRAAHLRSPGAPQVGRDGSLHEALGFLRVNLQAALRGRAQPILMLVGTAGGEGTSSLAAALADRLARSGQRVLLIDADLRRGTQERLWERGSGDFVWRQLCGTGGARHLQEALQQPDNVRVLEVAPHLHLLPAGPGAQDSLSLLDQPELGRALRCWGRHYDVVLVDSPPLLTHADGLAVGQQVDAVLIVAEAGRTRLQSVRQVLRRARAAHLPVLGAVLSQPSAPTRDVRPYRFLPRLKEVR